MCVSQFSMYRPLTRYMSMYQISVIKQQHFLTPTLAIDRCLFRFTSYFLRMMAALACHGCTAACRYWLHTSSFFFFPSCLRWSRQLFACQGELSLQKIPQIRQRGSGERKLNKKLFKMVFIKTKTNNALVENKSTRWNPFWWQLRMWALWGTWAPSLLYLLSVIIYFRKKQTKAWNLPLWTTGLWLRPELEFLTNKLFRAFVWGINGSGLRFSCPNLKNAAASWGAQGFPPLPEPGLHFVFLEDSPDWRVSPLALLSSAICCGRLWLNTSKPIKAAKHFRKSHNREPCVRNKANFSSGPQKEAVWTVCVYGLPCEGDLGGIP